LSPYKQKFADILFTEKLSITHFSIAVQSPVFGTFCPQLFSESITPDWLKRKVNECIRECNLLDYIRTDPFDGMPKKLASDVATFLTVMDEYLKDAVLLQNDKLFKKIQRFCCNVRCYNRYLARHMSPMDSTYYDIFETEPQKLDTIKKEIELYRTSIDEYYSKINPECTMF
jgi:hypothetical protein